MREPFLMFFALFVISCAPEKESCETRKDATIKITNALPYGFWFDVRHEIAEPNNKQFLLPNESYIYNVPVGDYKICGSFYSNDNFFKRLAIKKLFPCDNHEIVVPIEMTCSLFNILKKATIKNLTGQTIVVDINCQTSVNIAFAGEVTLQDNEECYYFEIPTGSLQFWYRYESSVHWRNTVWKYHISCSNALYECVPYKGDDAALVQKKPGNGINP
jgi:hypothetical protein